MQTYNSREFNQKTSQAQKAARIAPVFVTNRGKPDLVLMSHSEYLRLVGKKKSAFEVLCEMETDAADVELDIPPRSKAQRKPVEFD